MYLTTLIQAVKRAGFDNESLHVGGVVLTPYQLRDAVEQFERLRQAFADLQIKYQDARGALQCLHNATYTMVGNADAGAGELYLAARRARETLHGG